MSMQDFTIDDARHMLAWQYEMGADEALLIGQLARPLTALSPAVQTIVQPPKDGIDRQTLAVPAPASFAAPVGRSCSAIA